MTSNTSQRLKRIARATAVNLRASQRRKALEQITRTWTFMAEGLSIPGIYPHQLWPEDAELTARVPLAMRWNSELPLGERAIVAGIVAAQDPKTIFEFGTFTGETTALLADVAADDAHVHTIDLPAEALADLPEGFSPDMIGRGFRDTEKYGTRITSHRADIRQFDFEPFRGKVDLVFVDADHRYESVVRDSQIALALVSPTGTIVWDDYQPASWGVVKALNELAETVPVRRVAHSRFVVYHGRGAETP